MAPPTAGVRIVIVGEVGCERRGPRPVPVQLHQPSSAAGDRLPRQHARADVHRLTRSGCAKTEEGACTVKYSVVDEGGSLPLSIDYPPAVPHPQGEESVSLPRRHEGVEVEEQLHRDLDRDRRRGDGGDRQGSRRSNDPLLRPFERDRCSFSTAPPGTCADCQRGRLGRNRREEDQASGDLRPGRPPRPLAVTRRARSVCSPIACRDLQNWEEQSAHKSKTDFETIGQEPDLSRRVPENHCEYPTPSQLSDGKKAWKLPNASCSAGNPVLNALACAHPKHIVCTEIGGLPPPPPPPLVMAFQAPQRHQEKYFPARNPLSSKPPS